MRARVWRRVIISALVLQLAAVEAKAVEQVVRLGGGNALLDVPPNARVGIVLMPGGNGMIGISSDGSITRHGNTLIRVRRALAKSGFATLLIDGTVNPAEAVTTLRASTPRVLVAAMSSAGNRVGRALPSRPDGMIFVSLTLDQFKSMNSAASLPPTLVIYHPEDGCHLTPPSAVPGFLAWANGRATAIPISGGFNRSAPCKAHAYHGFMGVEGRVVGAMRNFARPRG